MTRVLRSPIVVILATAVLAGGLHWSVGWMATPLAGGVAGVWATRWHWWAGAAGVGGAWAAATVYTAAVAPGSFRVLLDTLGALGGNIPGEAFVALPVFVGSLLGALGGGIGRCLRLLWTGDA
jgi:hypothetical protein